MDFHFAEGDTVEIKSGGPFMTIESIFAKYGGPAKDDARCVWFSGYEAKSEVFKLAALKKVVVE